MVDPWPFDVAEIELMIPVCRVPVKKFGSEQEFRDAYTSCSAEVLTSRVIMG